LNLLERSLLLSSPELNLCGYFFIELKIDIKKYAVLNNKRTFNKINTMTSEQQKRKVVIRRIRTRNFQGHSIMLQGRMLWTVWTFLSQRNFYDRIVKRTLIFKILFFFFERNYFNQLVFWHPELSKQELKSLWNLCASVTRNIE